MLPRDIVQFFNFGPLRVWVWHPWSNRSYNTLCWPFNVLRQNIQGHWGEFLVCLMCLFLDCWSEVTVKWSIWRESPQTEWVTLRGTRTSIKPTTFLLRGTCHVFDFHLFISVWRSWQTLFHWLYLVSLWNRERLDSLNGELRESTIRSATFPIFSAHAAAQASFHTWSPNGLLGKFLLEASQPLSVGGNLDYG